MALPLVGIGRQLRKAGLRVRAVDGWRDRGRPDTFTPSGTVFHHTASSRTSGNAPSLGFVLRGTAEVPGPLCNLLIGRDGTVFLVAAGRANHAGFGGPLRGVPKDSANMHTIGVEVENDGEGEPWEPDLLRAADTTFAVLLDFVGGGVGRHMGHKEWAPDRKIDPGGISMDHDRDRVREIMRSLR
jgi:hypothetical protein